MSGTDGSWDGSRAILEDAARIVERDRNASYDAPENNFERIAAMWSVLLGHDVSAADVARCMTALKLVRDAFAPHRDNRTDAIGYVLCLERVEPTEQKVT